MSAPSGFTSGARTLAVASWGAVAAIPVWMVAQLINEHRERAEKKAAQSSLRRTSGGCMGLLSILLFGMTFYMALVLLAVMVILTVDAAVAAFALLVTLAWCAGIGFDRLSLRRRRTG